MATRNRSLSRFAAEIYEDYSPSASMATVTDSAIDESYSYQNAASCPDCGSGMIRQGSCFACPTCGFGSCG
jgi:predicted RNA-binding Zn-ribbon protein involved in translation (DUF1610 family)